MELVILADRHWLLRGSIGTAIRSVSDFAEGSRGDVLTVQVASVTVKQRMTTVPTCGSTPSGVI